MKTTQNIPFAAQAIIAKLESMNFSGTYYQEVDLGQGGTWPGVKVDGFGLFIAQRDDDRLAVLSRIADDEYRVRGYFKTINGAADKVLQELPLRARDFVRYVLGRQLSVEYRFGVGTTRRISSGIVDQVSRDAIFIEGPGTEASCWISVSDIVSVELLS